MTDRQHAVQFYESGRFLHREVQKFFDRALDDGQPSVMIARLTPRTRSAGSATTSPIGTVTSPA